jgi:hypothetical protein
MSIPHCLADLDFKLRNLLPKIKDANEDVGVPGQVLHFYPIATIPWDYPRVKRVLGPHSP